MTAKLIAAKTVREVFPFGELSKLSLCRLGASLPHRTNRNILGDNHIFLSSELEEYLL